MVNIPNSNSSSSPNTTMQAVPTDRDQLLLDIERALKIYYSLFLVLIGTVFNIFSILILSRSAFRRSPTSVYLRFLAFVDLFTLYNGLSRHFVSGISGYNIRELGEGFCKFNQWSTSFAPDISAWILVAVTTERVVSIVWPHKVRIVCSKMVAGVVVTVISLVIMASNLPLLIFYGNKKVMDVKTNDTILQKCVLLKPEYKTFIADSWYWIDLLKFVLLPSTVLILFNVIIISFVARSRRRVERSGSNTSSSAKRYGSGYSSSGIDNTTIGHDNNSNSSIRYSANSSRLGVNKEVSLTVTLLGINATFVICNTPIMVYLLGKDRWFPPDFGPEERLTLTAAVMAMYTNNAANFLMYCATGTRFRMEMRQLCTPILRLKFLCKENADDIHGASEREDNMKEFYLKNRKGRDLAGIMGSRETCCSQVHHIYG